MHIVERLTCEEIEVLKVSEMDACSAKPDCHKQAAYRCKRTEYGSSVFLEEHYCKQHMEAHCKSFGIEPCPD